VSEQEEVLVPPRFVTVDTAVEQEVNGVLMHGVVLLLSIVSEEKEDAVADTIPGVVTSCERSTTSCIASFLFSVAAMKLLLDAFNV